MSDNQSQSEQVNPKTLLVMAGGTEVIYFLALLLRMNLKRLGGIFIGLERLIVWKQK